MNVLVAIALVVLLGLGAWGCSRPGGRTATSAPGAAISLGGQISEISSPEVFQELNQAFAIYKPQVRILNPQPDEILKDNRVSVRFQVTDFPLFKNEDWGLGPHLYVFLDNQPYQAIYNPDEPLVLANLTPGTHTLRAFASRPWHESFKNEGAFAQATFHVFTKTPENNPDPNQPLLTYSRPQGTYGAEPIMLDFYLTNAPLHMIAEERSDDDILDWQIRCTINGQSFMLDSWQPIYLKGFKPGKNWIQLELLDENGNPFPNPFNNTARLITYEPKGQDTLSKLVRGELTAADVRGIVDPNYQPAPIEPEPTPTPTPVPELTPTPSPELTPTPTPSPEVPVPPPTVVEPTPTLAIPSPEPSISPKVEEQPEAESTEPEFTPEPVPDTEAESGEPESEVGPTVSPPPSVSSPESPVKGFFNRFRQRPVPVAPPPVVPSPPAVEPSAPPPAEEATSETEPTYEPQPVQPEISPSVAPQPSIPSSEFPKRGFFNRFRRQPVQITPPSSIVEPSVSPPFEEPVQVEELPKIESPMEEPTKEQKPDEEASEVEPATLQPVQPGLEVEPGSESPSGAYPELEVGPTISPQLPTPKSESSRFRSFLKRFHRDRKPFLSPPPAEPTTPSNTEESPQTEELPEELLPPTEFLPEIIESPSDSGGIGNRE
jgi:hypothetical protein